MCTNADPHCSSAPIFSGKDNKQPVQDGLPDTFSPEVKSLAGSFLQHEVRRSVPGEIQASALIDFSRLFSLLKGPLRPIFLPADISWSGCENYLQGRLPNGESLSVNRGNRIRS
jgi:hypothetical protein